MIQFYAECSLDCQNEGRCAEVNGVHECACPEGYTGIECETDIDECESSPCVRGSCDNKIKSYNCQCHPGYNGINCQININECDSSNCVHGTCFDMVNAYRCICSTGYGGTNCEGTTFVCLSQNFPHKRNSYLQDFTNIFMLFCSHIIWPVTFLKLLFHLILL